MQNTTAPAEGPVDAPTDPLERFERYRAAAMLIKGWFQPEAAAAGDSLLAHQATLGIEGHLFEIRVWEGKSASLMVMHADLEKERILLIDKGIGPEQLKVSLLLADIKSADSVQFMKSESRDLRVHPIMTEADHAFRWMHIDGEHTAGAVINDLEVADQLLSHEGIVCLDDFFNESCPPS